MKITRLLPEDFSFAGPDRENKLLWFIEEEYLEALQSENYEDAKDYAIYEILKWGEGDDVEFPLAMAYALWRIAE